jgi:addiction module HigA family antidote
MSSNPLTRGLRPVHPGEILREDVLPALGRSKTELAALLQISRQQLYDILGEAKPITPNTALRIGKLCGNGPDIWLRMQADYDLRMAREELGDVLAQIPTLERA